MLDENDLEVGGIYRLKARNMICGVWNGLTFIGIREKFGQRFLDESEVPYSTAFPLEKLGMVSANVRLRAYVLVENATLRDELEMWNQRCFNTHEPTPYPKETP